VKSAAEELPNLPKASNLSSQPTSEFVGTNQCFVCHRPHTDSWSTTKHVNAFTNLPKNYQQDDTCLKCHVTAFGQPGGFVSGTDKDFLMVGCEACHGGGSRHIDAAKRFVLANPGEEASIEKEMRETITKTPSDAVCSACHVTQSHGIHPPYDGQKPKGQKRRADAVAWFSQSCPAMLAPANQSSHAPTLQGRYTVKTCGACHYEQYKRWQMETHSDLSSMLPAQYNSDQSCTTCHRSSSATTRLVNAEIMGGDKHGKAIGLACESCHGPALEHVLFNRQFISRPPLTAALEQKSRNLLRQEKPRAACVQCHIDQGHKQHLVFQRADGQSAPPAGQK